MDTTRLFLLRCQVTMIADEVRCAAKKRQREMYMDAKDRLLDTLREIDELTEWLEHASVVSPAIPQQAHAQLQAMAAAGRLPMMLGGEQPDD